MLTLSASIPPFRTIRWFLLLFITVIPLFPQAKPFDTFVSNKAILATTFLFVLSGFNSERLWSGFDNASTKLMSFYLRKPVTYILGAAPLCIIPSCEIAALLASTLIHKQLPSNALRITRDSQLMYEVSFGLTLLWLATPWISAIADQLSALLAAILVVCMTIIVSASRIFLHDYPGISNFIVNPTLFGASFCLGLAAAKFHQRLTLTNAITWIHGLALDINIMAVLYFLRKPHSANYPVRVRDEIFAIFAFACACVLCAVNTSRDNSSKSVFYYLLSRKPLRSILPDFADSAFFLLHGQILYLYPKHAAQECLEGKGFLFYCALVTILSNLYTIYFWKPLADYMIQPKLQTPRSISQFFCELYHIP